MMISNDFYEIELPIKTSAKGGLVFESKGDLNFL